MVTIAGNITDQSLTIHFNGEAIDEFIENEVRDGFPGAALMVIQHGQILKENVYGYKMKYDEHDRLLDSPELLTLDTMFDLASLTKMFAANYALMQLTEEGKLNVDEPVRKYLPEYNLDTLVKDLLNHTAGYAPTIEFYHPEKVPPEWYSLEKKKTEEIIITKLTLAKEKTADALPVYSDIDYMLLGFIIERISGMSIDQYVQTNFYQPLGLEHTLFNPLKNPKFQLSDFAATETRGNSRGGTIRFPHERQCVVRGEVHDEKSFYSLDGLSGHAGLFSNLHDVSILCQVLLNHGMYENNHFWSEKVQNQFLTPYAADPSFGLGWRLNRNKSLPWFGQHASEMAYGHTGWTGICCVIDPTYSLAIVLLTNKRHTPYANGLFDGEKYETGKYGKIMTLVYEALSLQGEKRE